MANYNLTNLTAANNLLEVSVATNDLVGGLLFPFISFLVLIVAFVTLKQYNNDQALLAASFISTLLAGMLFIVGLVSEGVLLIHFVLLIVAVLVAYFSN